MTRKRSLPARIGGKQFTPRHKEAFLKIFSETNSVKQAAKAIGFTRACVYKHLKSDDEFREKFDEVNAAIVDNLEAEAYRRAVKGVKKPVYYQGELVGYELTYSDKLLEMLLRGRSDKYSNKTSLEVKGSIEHNHSVDSVKEKLLEKAVSRGLQIEDAEYEEIKDDNQNKDDTDEM